LKIAIASGKGGTGKTTIATNLAYLLKETGNRVLLTDCDVEEPNDYIFINFEKEGEVDSSILIPSIIEEKCTGCGKCSEICQFNAIATINKKTLVFPEMCHGCGACSYVCPENAILEKERVIGKISYGNSQEGFRFYQGVLNIGEALATPLIGNLIKLVNKNEKNYNYYIFDSSPGTSCPVIEVVKDVDYVIMVTEPTPFGLNDLRLAVEMARKLKIPYGVFINKSTIGNKDLWDYCKREAIDIIGELPNSKEIAMSYSNGRLILRDIPAFRKEFLRIIYAIEKVEK
jgi:MinD superfamily P-loop ATPase